MVRRARWVRPFGAEPGGAARADVPSVADLGGKGASLAEMAALGLPVPPGFTLPTALCSAYLGAGRKLPPDLDAEFDGALAELERTAGLRFGDAADPLLVAVRSGAPASMPGMMDTVLNVGLNDRTVEGLAQRSGDSRFAWDTYRRFIQMYADVVLGLDVDRFERLYEARRRDHGERPWSDAELRGVTTAFLDLAATESGAPFPQDPRAQLWGAIRAVLESWNSRRAVTYRRLRDIPDTPGTAVTIQAMVFGNAGDGSATGVGFTRDPATGAPAPFGEYLPNAQGDDVVSGTRTPRPLTQLGRIAIGGAEPSLEEAMPAVYGRLVAAFRVLEQRFGTMQDVEFTVERGRLWLLQTRSGMTSTTAALRIAADMAAEGLTTPEAALRRLDPASLGRLLHPSVPVDVKREVLARGLPASPGAATGAVVFTVEDAQAYAARREPAVLVLTDTSPRDIHGIHAAAAVLTSRGGATSHAAIVARSMGRPCVVGAGDVRVDAGEGRFTAAGRSVKRGDIVTVDGTSGEVSLGALPLERAALGGAFDTVLGWADRARRLRVRANTETPEDVRLAREFGAEGIGLFRTEYSFLAAEPLALMRRLILADGAAARADTLAALRPLLQASYTRVFARGGGLPITVRLLDLPLAAFMPHTPEEITEAARAARTTEAEVAARARALAEVNPVLGHRGCRLAISWPDLYAAQVRAILQAALEAEAAPQILVPVISSAAEFEVVHRNVAAVAAEVAKSSGAPPPYSIGAMIELPRAALEAGRLARTAEFLSFGTNNLTQATLGVSRDDAAAFLERYRRERILSGDPFVTLDT